MNAKGIVELRRQGVTERGRVVAKRGMYWYVLKARNGRILTDSELLANRADAERTIQKYFGEPEWKFKDLTGDA